jgi:nucleoside-diphosphate-sugar epimerase
MMLQEDDMHGLRVLVTGANGFVGQSLCPALRSQGHEVLGAVRDITAGTAPDNQIAVGDIHGRTDWTQALHGVDVVIHLAGRAHRIQDRGQAFSLYRRVNLEGTENLAVQAAREGVRRLIFVSSIKVNGEVTTETPFTETDPPNPKDPYAITKWEAEQALAEVSAATGLEHTVLRPPLVHGPGVKGNLLRLLHSIQQGRSLPLGAVRNQRSLVGVDNLCAALCLCASHARTGTYLVADHETISTPDLIRILAKTMNRRPGLISVPLPFMELAARLVKRQAEFQRLTGSLLVNARKIHTELGWSPGKTLHQGLTEMAQWHMASAASNAPHNA